MRSLFIKIFLWFWVAMALLSFVSLLSAIATESHPFVWLPWLKDFIGPPLEGRVKVGSESVSGRWINLTGNIVRLSGQTAINIYEREGQDSLTGYIDHLSKTVRTELYIFTQPEVQLTAWEIPEEAKKLVNRAQTNQVDFKRTDDAFWLAQILPGARGNYILLARFPAKHFITRDPSLLLMHLLIILCTAGAVCYWLARYISRPVSRLGAAARNFADGDLKVRVGGVVGNRRDEIADLAKDFDIMAERIESLVMSQKRLLRDISHEFRSPLTRLTIALEIARQRRGEESTKALDRIELEAQRLNTMIGELLTLARLDSGTELADPVPVDLAQLVDDIVADAGIEAERRNIALHVAADENCIVFGARDLLRSAVENVLRNAIRYANQGTEISVSLRHKAAGNNSMAVLNVRDHGRGVPEEALKDLFAPFYRVSDARDRKEGGTGLGLAITQRAVRLHGGEVRAANAPDGGLIITIELPNPSECRI